MTFIKKILLTAVTALGLFMVYAIFIYMPVTVYTEAECLRESYPEYRVSVGLERYCITLDGAIIVKIDKQ